MGRLVKKYRFADIPLEFTVFENAEIVILPVPYDKTSTWQKGSDKGPQALLLASSNLELYDIDTDYEVYKHGISVLKPVRSNVSPEKLFALVHHKTLSLLEAKKFPVLIGGEHSISIGAVKAFTEHFKNITVVQFDAHADLRDSYMGSKYNHACVMARIKEYCPFVQIGIRSYSAEEKRSIIEQNIFWAKDIIGRIDWIEELLEITTEDIYITFDLDVFDPSLFPSTGTPEPGGLYWHDVIHILTALSKKRNIVGFDVVELCPQKYNQYPNYIAALLVYKLLSLRFSNIN